jgi:hypothetical protein
MGMDSVLPFSAALERVSYSARPGPAGDGGDIRKQNFTHAYTKLCNGDCMQWAKLRLVERTGPTL